jgi:ABC-2 type transport system ATP-binding protein
VSEPVISIRDLHKSYGDVAAVRGVDLDIESGEVFALLGPNGAGKTTLVEILEGYRNRDRGQVTVLGSDPADGDRAMRRRVGIVLQETGLDPFLTAAETIERYRGYYPTPLELDEVIELVGLTEKRDVRVTKLSGGQRRRLDVAIGLAGNPELLFLDEPTTGFDPYARRGAWEMIRNLQSLGKTILLTTHYMEEAQSLAGRVGIIVSGRIVAVGSPDALTSAEAIATTISFRLPPGNPAPPADLGATKAGDRFELTPERPMHVLHELTGWAIRQGIELEDLRVARPSLEDVYLELTGTEESIAT